MYRLVETVGGNPKLSSISSIPFADLVFKFLGTQGQAEIARQRAARLDAAKLDLDRIVLFIDDLDRCDPREAVKILANVNRNELLKDANCVILCDPNVLASHVASEFGVESRDGLQSISKYIHAPLFLPTGETPQHTETLEEQARRIGGVTAELLKAARFAVGKVPIREVLAALPQASLWLSCISGPMQEQANAFLCISMLGNAYPRLIGAIHRNPASLLPLRQMLGSLVGGDGPAEAILVFGSSLRDEFFLRRPDMADLCKLLLPNNDGLLRQLGAVVARFTL
jgi:hypothetical protein